MFAACVWIGLAAYAYGPADAIGHRQAASVCRERLAAATPILQKLSYFAWRRFH